MVRPARRRRCYRGRNAAYTVFVLLCLVTSLTAPFSTGRREVGPPRAPLGFALLRRQYASHRRSAPCPPPRPHDVYFSSCCASLCPRLSLRRSPDSALVRTISASVRKRVVERRASKVGARYARRPGVGGPLHPPVGERASRGRRPRTGASKTSPPYSVRRASPHSPPTLRQRRQGRRTNPSRVGEPLTSVTIPAPDRRQHPYGRGVLQGPTVPSRVVKEASMGGEAGLLWRRINHLSPQDVRAWPR